MAIFRPGHTIGAVSGNIGGQNFVQGTKGPYVRSRPRHIKRTHPVRMEIQTRFKNNLIGWRNMPNDLRLSWNNAAKLISFQNRLGVTRQISGFNLYMKYQLDARVPDATPSSPPTHLVRLPTLLTLVINPDEPIYVYGIWPVIPDLDIASILWQGSRSYTTSVQAHMTRWKFFLKDSPTRPFFYQNIRPQFTNVLGAPSTGEYFAIRVRIQTGTSFMSPWYSASATAI